MSGYTVGRRAFVTAAMATLAGCAEKPSAPAPVVFSLGPDRTGYMLFQAPINDQTYNFFVADVSKMLDLNASEIHIGISSPGGVVRSAENFIAYMDRIHADRGVTFVTHNVGVVASAACYVFLAGQRRYSVPRGAFLFHEAGLQANGLLTGQVLDQAAAELKRDERIFLSALKARTRLSDGEALSFVHRTVILTAAEAQRDGITDGTADFAVPRSTPVAAIRSNPPAASQKPATAAPL